MRFAFLKRPKFFVPVAGIIIAAVLIFAVIRNMDQPAVGDISQQPQLEALKPDPYANPGTFNGKYVSFRYPAHFKKVPDNLAPPTLEVARYHSTDSTSKLINVAVYKGNINDESGVAYRRQHTDLYTESSSQKWLEFTKKDGTEDTFYIPHDGLLASVSVTAPYNNQAGDALFVASSLKWR